MVNRREYQFLLADRAELDRLIAMTPESAVLARMSLESRRRQVVEELEVFRVPLRWPAEAKLTFSGKPVVGGTGIDAAFGVKVVKAFADAVATVGAAKRTSLPARGPIPNREDYRLMITGTTRGSFGFELQETLEPGRPVVGWSYVEGALEHVRSILQSSTTGDDDSLASAITEVHPRAIASLRTFVKTVLDYEAICTFSFNGRVFRYSDASEVRRSYTNLGPKNIREWEDELVGAFEGYLPRSKRAEFRDYRTRSVISLRVDPRVSGDNENQINDILRQRVHVRVHARQVGNGTPIRMIVSISR